MPVSSSGSTPTGATCSPAGPAREHAIAVSCRAKAAIVARDERETGDRMLLNLGHTFGHAFEAAAGFSDRLLHGEAIGARHVARVRVLRPARACCPSRRRPRHRASCGGRAADPCQSRVRRQLARRRAMMDLISQDKKVQRGRLTFILVRGIGAGFCHAAMSKPTRSAPSSPKSLARNDDSRRLACGRRYPASACCCRSSSPAAKPR